MASILFSSGPTIGPDVYSIQSISPQPLIFLVVCGTVPPNVGLFFNNSSDSTLGQLSQFVRPWTDAPKIRIGYSELFLLYGASGPLGFAVYRAMEFTGENFVVNPRTDLGTIDFQLEIPSGFVCESVISTPN